MSQVGLLGEDLHKVSLALLINLHFIDGLLELVQGDLVRLLQLHVLFFELCQVA